MADENRFTEGGVSRGERTAAFKAAYFRRAVRDVGAAFVS